MKKTLIKLIKLINPFYIDNGPLKILLQKQKVARKNKDWEKYTELDRQIFNLRYLEMFGVEASDSEYKDYENSPGEERVAFIEDLSVGKMILSGFFYAILLIIILIVIF